MCVGFLSAQNVNVTVFLKGLEDQKEIADVNVYVGDSLRGKTNAEGFFTFSEISEGIKKLAFVKEGFRKIEADQELLNGGFYEFSLTPSILVVAQNNITDSLKVDSIAVVVPKKEIKIENKEENVSVFRAKAKVGSEVEALSEQRKSNEIKEIRSGEELSRKGAGNVSKGVEKGAGISNVQGRGIFVRGLEDRYNNLLINGLAVPSNNPFTKIIDLSLIPSDVVGNLEIYKTYNSNIYGDFAGATINIETVTPQKPVTRINFGAQYVTDNNMAKFLMGSRQNSTAGFFGLRGSERAIPGVYGTDPLYNPITVTGQNGVDAFKSGFNVDQINSTNNSSYGFFHAGKISRKLNYLVTSNFDNKYQIREGIDRAFNLGVGNLDNDFKVSEYKYLTNFSTLGVVNLKLDRGSLGLNALYLKSTQASIKDQVGTFNAGTSGDVLIRANEYQDSRFLNIQLLGDYFLTENKKHKINAGVSYNTNSLVQPDRNFILGRKVSDNEISIDYSGQKNLLRQYFDVKGKYYVSQMAEYNWFFGKTNDYNKLSIGYNGYLTSYESNFRFISPIGTSVPFNVNLNNIDNQINTDLLNGSLSFKEGSTEQYKSLLNDFVAAPYVNLFYQLSEKLQANVGVRSELFNREIAFKNVGSIDFIIVNNNDINILPAINLKYTLDRKSNLRFAASQTTTRPTIMEVVPLQYSNPDNTSVLGREDLKFSQNSQVDLKYEIFPSSTELFATSIFGKHIQNPIEKGLSATGNSGIITFFNSKEATVLGAELEFIFALKRLNTGLKNFKLGANASYLYTNVKVNRSSNQVETFDERALQGASKWILNADIKYDFKFSQDWQNTLSTVFNVYGKRIFAVGATGLDHIYENPMPTLDLVWTSTLSKNWKLNLNASNILNPTYRLEHGANYDKSKITITENSLVTKEFRKGVSVGLSATYSF